MRRAIVYVAWGKACLSEAQASAATTLHINADRILITDSASLLIQDHPAAFDHVIEHDFRLEGLARKVEMFELLPAQYDSFLYLDADTHVLMDLDAAFERAERHGLAAAQAAHYSLEHFWGFSDHLDRIGFRSGGLLQYNSGVIFFTRNSSAWTVLEAWRDLCANAATDELAKWTDQPYLTLAMELAGFNPYTLSIAYNYRNFGELISGTIRIWHSRLAPPTDVNQFEEPWPPRRFFAGERLPHGVARLDR